MIEIRDSGNFKTYKSVTGEYKRRHYQLYIDDVLFDEVNISAGGDATDGGRWFELSTGDYEAFEQLASYSYFDLTDEVPGLATIWLTPKFNWAESITSILIGLEPNDQPYSREAFLEISFIFKPNWETWRKPYTAWEYFSELSKLIVSAGSSDIKIIQLDDEGLAEGFWVTFPHCSQDSLIANEFAGCTNVLMELHKHVERTLASHLSSDSIVAYFDFPEEIKVSCEQYLLYFIQFLRDLGVEANSDLRHEAGQVLFFVTPNDPQQALYKIRTALEIYLHLPASPLSEMEYSEIELQHLMFNIHRLKSDLALSQAILQAKDATIQAHQLTIAQQQKLLSGTIIVESLKDIVVKSEKDREELLDGVVALTKYERKGIEVNLPEIFRKLRRLFTDKK